MFVLTSQTHRINALDSLSLDTHCFEFQRLLRNQQSHIDQRLIRELCTHWVSFKRMGDYPSVQRFNLLLKCYISPANDMVFSVNADIFNFNHLTYWKSYHCFACNLIGMFSHVTHEKGAIGNTLCSGNKNIMTTFALTVRVL